MPNPPVPVQPAAVNEGIMMRGYFQRFGWVGRPGQQYGAGGSPAGNKEYADLITKACGHGMTFDQMFDPNTLKLTAVGKEAIKHFQREHNCPPIDGIIGPKTIAKMQEALGLPATAPGIAAAPHSPPGATPLPGVPLPPGAPTVITRPPFIAPPTGEVVTGQAPTGAPPTAEVASGSRPPFIAPPMG